MSTADIVAIARKPVPERTYEEQIALNFSEPILDRLLASELQRRETQRIEETAAFLREYDLLNRFGGSMNKAQIEAVRAEYDSNGADADVLFAFHLLTAGGKAAFLSVLSGLLSDIDNLQVFTDKMDKAQANIIERLAAQRAEDKKG